MIIVIIVVSFLFICSGVRPPLPLLNQPVPLASLQVESKRIITDLFVIAQLVMSLETLEQYMSVTQRMSSNCLSKKMKF